MIVRLSGYPLVQNSLRRRHRTSQAAVSMGHSGAIPTRVDLGVEARATTGGAILTRMDLGVEARAAAAGAIPTREDLEARSHSGVALGMEAIEILDDTPRVASLFIIKVITEKR